MIKHFRDACRKLKYEKKNQNKWNFEQGIIYYLELYIPYESQEELTNSNSILQSAVVE